MNLNRKAIFHMGIDYAVVMLEGQTTDKPLASFYGTSEEVKYYGEMLVKAINIKKE